MNGSAAEDLALAHLLRQGLRLIMRNYRSPRGELDLVMRDDTQLVIVEVRKRSHPGFGSAAESVDARKRGRIMMATQALLAQHAELARLPVRFDVIALDRDDHIDWLQAAFDTDS